MQFMPEPMWRKGPPFDVIELVGDRRVVPAAWNTSKSANNVSRLQVVTAHSLGWEITNVETIHCCEKTGRNSESQTMRLANRRA